MMKTINNLITDHIDIWTAAETEKKSGRGRSSGNAGSVYGIKKLRELILELAVRGKLVPQDANDEPASELLKRIQAEKAKFVVEGKIKKSKPLPAIADDEKLLDLPRGWEWVRLNDFVLSILSGGTPSKNNLEFWNGDIPWASVKDLNVEKFLETTQDSITQEGFEAGSKLANKGDLLICTRMGLGKIAIAAIDVAINQDLKALKITSLLDIDYFINFYSTLKIIGSGMTVAGIRQDELLGYCVPTPPLAEQHRIVAKVDELMALCDQLETQHSNAAEAHEKLVSHLLGTLTQSPVRPEPVEPHPSTSSGRTEFEDNWQRIAAHFDTLFTTEASIDALKQILLQLAVMGKLVPQDPNDEPASELLKRIQAEKAKLVVEGKIKKDKPLAAITEKEKPFVLPESWEWVQLGTISEFINGDRGKNYPNRSEYVSNGIPWINTGHIEPDGKLTTLEMNYISREKFNILNGGKIQLGDLVYCLRGATFGKTAIVDPYFEGAIASSLMIIRPSRQLSKEFMFRYLVSQTGKSQVFRFDNGSAQPNLSANNVKLYVFPLPPVKEQIRIVTKVDELMSLCDQLKARITQAKLLQQKLADVLVEQAVTQ